MKLLVCDLDGTLTRTNAVDEECFVRAFADAFGIRNVNTAWAEYEHVTDLGVLHEVFCSTFNRLPDGHEIGRFAECFVGLLDDRHVTSGDGFEQVPGAASLLLNLTDDAEWKGVIATGSLKAAATFKIRAARLPADHIRAAFAEDGPSREAIVRTAIGKAKEQYGVRQFERIVSIGDAVWDVRTARHLELPFVGVGAGRRAVALREAGATTVLEDFVNYERCIECFERATVPSSPSV